MSISWKPNRSDSIADKKALAQLLMSGVDTYLSLLPAFRAREARSALRGVLGEDEAAPGLHPDLFQWFYAFRDSMQSKSSSAVNAQLRGIEATVDAVTASHRRAAWNQEHLGIPVDMTGEPDRLPATLAKLTTAAREAAGQCVDIEIIREPSEEVRLTTQRAFALLRRVWPEIEQEIEDFIQRIVFFEGGPTIGAADIRYHGAIFLTCTLRSTPVGVAEEIVHESSHARLNAILATRPLFTNDPAQRFATPLRRDLRPMFGLFHQMYVLSRLHEFFLRVVGEFPEKRRNLSEVRAQIERALAAVRLHGVLTPAGAAMVDDIEQTLAQKARP